MNHQENQTEQELIDINEIRVSGGLSREQRIAEFVRQIRNPYHFRCNNFTVRVHFNPGGPTIDDCLAGILR